MALTKTSNQVIQSPYRKNFIINGGFNICQRGASFTLSTSPQYTLDRWIVYAGGTGVTGTIASASHGNSASYKGLFITGAGWTSGYPLFITRLESADTMFLRGKTITISAKVYHDFGTAASFGIVVDKANSLDNFSAFTNIHIGTAKSIESAVVTEVSTSFTIAAADCLNGLQIGIQSFDFTTVSNKTVAICDAQLEIGSVVTPFEFRHFGEEVALCQRYYEKSYDLSVYPGTIGGGGRAQWLSNYTATGVYHDFIGFRVQKRAIPTMSFYSDATGAVGKLRNASGGADITINSLPAAGQSGYCGPIGTVESMMNMYSYTWHWVASAEL